MLEIIENEKESNKKKPPKHIADFDLKDRKKFAEELGLPGFRADQVSRHWFGQLSDNFDEWTDLPAGERQKIAELLTPKLSFMSSYFESLTRSKF